MRADGTRVRGLSPIVQALPYIMPRRYDAQNWANDYVDEEILRNYIRQKRRGWSQRYAYERIGGGVLQGGPWKIQR